MQEKGQETEYQKNLSQMLGTMTKVVFDMMPLLLEDIDALVFNLPN